MGSHSAIQLCEERQMKLIGVIEKEGCFEPTNTKKGIDAKALAKHIEVIFPIFLSQINVLGEN